MTNKTTAILDFEKLDSERQKIKCNVAYCKEIAEYYNPRSNFKYCQKHFDRLGGKIIYETNKYGKILNSQILKPLWS